MDTFYDEWLRYWEDEKEERRKARKVIHEEELQWVRTQQDWRSALMASPQNNFYTSGLSMLGEIPEGWHTGKHSHGEEAIYVLQGQGFTVVDDIRYEWDAGSCVFMPYGLPHQHYNSGKETVRYFSAMALPLERYIGIAKVMQYEEAGERPLGEPADVKEVGSEIHPELGRIVLRLKDAPLVTAKEAGEYRSKRTDEFAQAKPKEMKTPGTPGHRSRSWQMMDAPENGFKAKEVEITGLLCDEAGKHSGKHSHMEAQLYVVQGEGYSIIDGGKIDWKKGSLIQVQGPQTVHQHFNTGSIEAQQIRVHFGIRSKFFQNLTKRVFPYRYYEFSSYG